MTVSTEVDHNDYTGNGVTTSFPYTFRIFQKSDLVVQVVDLDENIITLMLDTDYTITGAGGFTGGNVVLTSALANGYQISISRVLPVTQETDLRNQGKFFAEVHEDAFDKLTMLIQQVRSWFSLALRKPSFVANYYDAINNYIRNLRDPSLPQDAATKNYVDIQSNNNLEKTLRVPENYINPLPNIDGRKNKALSFDNSGNPLLLDPAGSGLWGYTLIDSFQLGADISTRFQALHWSLPDGDGEYYRWDGQLPKLVPPGSTPASTGGIGPGAWLSVGDATLRSDLISDNPIKGSDIVTYTPKFNDGVSMSVSDKFAVDLVTLSDYGFKVGNTGAQNLAAFQKAIDTATLPTHIVIPEGAFVCDPGVTVKNTVTMISGAGSYQTRIFSTGSGAMITQQTDAIAFCEFRDFGLHGNGFSSFGFYLPEANHCKFENVDVAGTTSNAILINGYSIDVIGCRILENTGNALSIGGYCNNINILNNRIYSNGSGGIVLNPAYVEGGMSVRLNGNDVEQNKWYGLMAYGIKGLNVDGNYWERNGEVGYQYPEFGGVRVFADIHLISNEFSITPVLSKINDTVSIRGNQQTAIGYASSLPNQNGFIFTNHAKNLVVENNQMLAPDKNSSLICVYDSHYVTDVESDLFIRSNSRNDIGFIGTPQDTYDHVRWGHFINDVNHANQINLLTTSLLSWFRYAGSSGSLIKTTNTYNNNYSFLVTDGDSVWATAIDLSKQPWLKGKRIWFGAWVNDQGNASRLTFGINGKYSNDTAAPVSGDGTWKFVSCCVYVSPVDTVIRATVQKYGSGSVLINSPIIAEIGVSYNMAKCGDIKFYAPSVPTTGTWDVGERVINSAPGTGKPKAWTCNVSGGPGTYSFLSEGNF
ncbi:right-handed parallel beta-helix repeat-containing protein [Escherichia coli]